MNHLVLTFDHDYDSYPHFDASKFFARIMRAKRQLEKKEVSLRQIGQCSFTIAPDQKEQLFSSISECWDSMHSNWLEGLKFSFEKIEYLNHEYEDWKRSQH